MLPKTAWKRTTLLASLLALSLAAGCSETDEPLGPSKSHETLQKALGFQPGPLQLIYTWHRCCDSKDPFGGDKPASRCVVAQLNEHDFKKVSEQTYPKVDWKTIDTKCTGPGYGENRMKGCSAFSESSFPKPMTFVLHGETCRASDGTRLKIDAENRIVMVETYVRD